MAVWAASANQELLLLRSELAARRGFPLPENHVPVALRLRGELNAVAVQNALSQLVQRHSAFRTGFKKALGAHPPGLRDCLLNVFQRTSAIIPGMYVQCISSFANLPVEQKWLDTGQVSPDEEEIHRTVELEATVGLDAETAPIARATVLSVSTTEHILILVLSHLISDIWSVQIFQREFAALYSAYCSARLLYWAPPLQHCEFVAWEHKQIRSGAFDRQLRFWDSVWRAHPDALIWHKELPFAKVSRDTEMPKPRVRTCGMTLTPAESDAVRRLAKALRVTPYVVVRTALTVWLHFVTDRLDIGFWANFANRTYPGSMQMFGYCATSHVIFSKLSRGLSAHSLCLDIANATREAQENEAVSLAALWCLKARSWTISDTRITFDLWSTARPRHTQQDVEPYLARVGPPWMDLDVRVLAHQDVFEMFVTWNEARYDSGGVLQMARALRSLVAMITASDYSVAQLRNHFRTSAEV